MLKLKDEQVIVNANKIDTITYFLKNRDLKDFEEDATENEMVVMLHELDEDVEYSDSLEEINKNETHYSIENEYSVCSECNDQFSTDFATLWPQPNCPGQCQTRLSQLGPQSGIIITLYHHPPPHPPSGAHVWIDYISAISQRMDLKFCIMTL